MLDLQPKVVVPAHNAGKTLETCLSALCAAGFEPSEITVVDDGSCDNTVNLAHNFGVNVVSNDTAKGPARARNLGAGGAEGDVLVFVDADVALHADARRRILDRMAADPGLEAVIGSYDDAPPFPTVVSRYRNLLHHFTHQRAHGRVQTFWTGIGAVRRESFMALGGFDPAWESIEDVEFGVRLTEAGKRIELDRAILGTHLKAWTVRGMFKTDLWGRAVPWTRLLLGRRASTGALNTSRANRVGAAAAAVGLPALVAAPFAPGAIWLALVALGAFVGANAIFLRKLSKVGGPVFAIQAIPFHMLHYSAALAGYAFARIERFGVRRGSGSVPR